MKALTHIHSAYSWDGNINIVRLADALVKEAIELALVSDHDDFGGSLALRQLIEQHQLPIRVPVAAEIRTDHGDIIVALEDGKPPGVSSLAQWTELPRVVRDHGGIIWLPHPYRSHTNIEELAAEADVIEVFNARCTPAENALAAELCERHGAVPAYGADVHRLGEIGRFVSDYQSASTILTTLLTAPSCPSPMRTRVSDIMAAEITNGIKRRRPTLVGYFALKWVKHRVKEVAGMAPSEK